MNDIIEQTATKYEVSKNELIEVLKNTVLKPTRKYTPTDADVKAFLLIANRYDLDPFKKEIHAFVSRGGIVPVVGIDGFVTLANRVDRKGWSAEIKFADTFQEIGKYKKPCPEWCEVTITRSNGSKVTVREWLDEVFGGSQGDYDNAWDTHPKRMLRHKTLAQALRLAYGLSGIYDEDEAQRIVIQQDLEQGEELIPPQEIKEIPTANIEEKPQLQEMPTQQPPEKVEQKEEIDELIKEINGEVVDAGKPVAKPVTKKQLATLFSAMIKNGIPKQSIPQELKTSHGITKPEEITEDNYQQILAFYSKGWDE
ncbi:MAG: hypothetical protein KatS3mg087_1643 [Patescibacteria group bacterium]|nr:MAG: hypothetical protein KatS3mg087_1643 [Patescibacteria group bacterium]